MLPFAANQADATTAPAAIQTLRLREEPPPITQTTRTSRKRKSPSSASKAPENHLQNPPPPPPPHPQMHLPPMIVHPMAGPPPLPYHYDFTPGGLPPPPNPVPQHPDQLQSHANAAAGRALSNSKRAEQNRKAQRAFRERRDQHVKALESRSQLLDAALASADEANRRWEECRTIVDQLRVENAALRAALAQQAHLLPPGVTVAAAAAAAAAASNLPQQTLPQSADVGTAEHCSREECKDLAVSELKVVSTEESQEMKKE